MLALPNARACGSGTEWAMAHALWEAMGVGKASLLVAASFGLLPTCLLNWLHHSIYPFSLQAIISAMLQNKRLATPTPKKRDAAGRI